MIQPKGLVACVIVIGVTTTAAAWQQQGNVRAETVLAEQRGAPVTILGYAAFTPPRMGFSPTSKLPEINHSLRFRNDSERPIDTVQFGLVSFDIFDEVANATTQVWRGVINPGESRSFNESSISRWDSWLQTGFAYVSRVRFKKGEVWMADEPAVLAQIREILPEFQAKDLPKPER